MVKKTIQNTTKKRFERVVKITPFFENYGAIIQIKMKKNEEFQRTYKNQLRKTCQKLTKKRKNSGTRVKDVLKTHLKLSCKTKKAKL